MNFTPSFIKTKERAGNPIEDVRYGPVSQYMVCDLITFQEEQAIHEVISTLLKNKISGAPVVNLQDELVGIISEKDCLRVLIDDAYYNNPLFDRKVKDFMSPDVFTVTADTDLICVAKAFMESNFRRYPVVDEAGKLVGQISRKDVLKASLQLHSTTWY
ncbi:CBS domain-containing protein [Nafulsella turpanensis]|uniref:CBS domain-containing protein n=1 Tax=Nafulsella turpanensis TaxID=1265690 RepID=UPI000344E6CF|nr:CBS domain-containing protein [Nafulsella turpanensis]